MVNNWRTDKPDKTGRYLVAEDYRDDPVVSEVYVTTCMYSVMEDRWLVNRNVLGWQELPRWEKE